ncbi:hypothetical protein F6V30_14015 [Oryzomonas sagensis]|uniref:Uncharacterized protein n=1 Tax=Oryzomonas sagensis TaxID=2603857 RepID=A0ABQ6TL07_9BACT|nr:hypothetical protein [Oryzomonas sagensis]KAB0668949.1 hypothetical protein F6V30_14015 [Oryzomonas sagensis]
MRESLDDLERLIKERELMREWVQHPGAALIAGKLRGQARMALKRQLDADPYTQPDEIKRNQQLRYVLTVMLPGIIEGIVNYDPAAVDKKVPLKKRWSIFEWFRK